MSDARSCHPVSSRHQCPAAVFVHDIEGKKKKITRKKRQQAESRVCQSVDPIPNRNAGGNNSLFSSQWIYDTN